MNKRVALAITGLAPIAFSPSALLAQGQSQGPSLGQIQIQAQGQAQAPTHAPTQGQTQAQGQTPPPLKPMDMPGQQQYFLPEGFITATGRPEPISRLVGTVQVIHQDRIAKSTARSVTELLNENAVAS